MSMTAKDYVKVATILGKGYARAENEFIHDADEFETKRRVLATITADFVAEFKAENSRFSETKFRSHIQSIRNAWLGMPVITLAKPYVPANAYIER